MTPFGLELSHSDHRSSLQYAHSPQPMTDTTTTRSPTDSCCTPAPISTTSPINSWPIMSPARIVGTNPLMRCRSEPHTELMVTFTMASRGFNIFGSSTRSSFRLRTLFQRNAFISLLYQFKFAGPLSGRLPFGSGYFARFDNPFEVEYFVFQHALKNRIK